jgi:drug/metabolite transporter (DMT)-like permease
MAAAQQEYDAWAIAGTLAVVVASILYAIASIFLQRETERLDTITLATATMLGATVALLPFGLAQAPLDLPGWEAAAAVVALGVAGTGIGILLFMKIISDYGSFRAGLVTYLLPVTALLYGAFLLDEEITAWMVVGLALILAGVALGSGLLRPSPTPEAVEPARP